MESEGTITTTTNQRKDLRTQCPYCLSLIDLNLDKRGRPYWVCVGCQTRTFATRTTLDRLKADGWVWCNERPLVALRAWLKRVGLVAGIDKKVDG